MKFRIGEKEVGDGCPAFIVAEIGLNHNGDVEIAKKLIDAARDAGADAVKFQKRHPRTCTPKDQWDNMRDTPWGYISYIDYREKIEFGPHEYNEIASYCYRYRFPWFCSFWDVPSLKQMMNAYPLPAIKIPSAMLTNTKLLELARFEGKPIILSTGMSTITEIRRAIETLYDEMAKPPPLAILHCTSSYPCPLEELNLRVLDTWSRIPKLNRFVLGYSGHEPGLAPTLAAVALGAKIIERHITLDRAMFGSDQAASLEPTGFRRLVKDVRAIELALGDGIKKVYPSEEKIKEKLRGA